MSFSWLFMNWPFISWLAQVALMVAVALVVGKRVPHVRKWLWLALIILVGGKLLGFLITIIGNQIVLGSIGAAGPSAGQLTTMAILQSLNLALTYISMGATFVCYCVAALKAFERSDQPPLAKQP